MISFIVVLKSAMRFHVGRRANFFIISSYLPFFKTTLEWDRSFFYRYSELLEVSLCGGKSLSESSLSLFTSWRDVFLASILEEGDASIEDLLSSIETGLLFGISFSDL